MPSKLDFFPVTNDQFESHELRLAVMPCGTQPYLRDFAKVLRHLPRRGPPRAHTFQDDVRGKTSGLRPSLGSRCMEPATHHQLTPKRLTGVYLAYPGSAESLSHITSQNVPRGWAQGSIGDDAPLSCEPQLLMPYTCPLAFFAQRDSG
ncbi:hypothetical protein BS50DRAFT_206713 [Corynespora cassiicola Philippines]|uniref:Uncharacterized protein n=1 Tax=Corynespora cassiicola Philippines TaxID=1448308 RepID=A0A2T2N4H7_CORCC|nr:hypothetical protein BS50DRAFT_206713 [Corynespora cassiicola Philippines]